MSIDAQGQMQGQAGGERSQQHRLFKINCKEAQAKYHLISNIVTQALDGTSSDEGRIGPHYRMDASTMRALRGNGASDIG